MDCGVCKITRYFFDKFPQTREAERGIHAASTSAHPHAQNSSNALANPHTKAT